MQLLQTTLILLARIVVALPVRWLRWLAVMQQKEYRVDRWWLHFQSPEGKVDFWRILPATQELTKTGLKRPVRTPRLYLLAVTSFLVILLFLYLLYWLINQSFQTLFAPPTMAIEAGSVLLAVLLTQLLLPVVIVVVSAPFSVISWLLTRQTERRAARLLAQTNPFVIGITGSYGKSSTKHLLGHVLAQHDAVYVTPKSYNTSYSIARSVAELYQGQPLIVVEYGAYMPGEIAQIASWLPPSLGVITGFAPQHLGLFGTKEAIIQAKAEMVAALPVPRTVIINGINPRTKEIAEAGAATRVIDATGPESTETLHHCDVTSQGVLSFVWRGHTITTRLLGKHYQEVVLVVIAAALELGLSETEIVAGLESFVPGRGFIQLLPGHRNSQLLDDGGTSNPAGFKAILELAKIYSDQGKKITLITAGIIDLGSDAELIHQELALLAKPVVDQVIYLSQIGYEQFVTAQLPTVRLQSPQETAWQRFLTTLSTNDIVVIEGKVPSWVYEAVLSSKAADQTEYGVT